MDILTSHQMRRLAEVVDPSCVSLLSPTHPTGRETRQDPIRFKNLLGKAEEALIARGRRAAMFHGHPGGEASSDRKQRLLEYCRLIDQRLRKAVGDAEVPLVLACEERLAAIFREASDHDRIAEESVSGNPDARNPADLCGEAAKLLEPKVVAARDEALARYHQAVAGGQAAGPLDTVLGAAHDGRVDTMLVAADGEERWGRYDARQGSLELHDPPGPDDEELVNLATVVAYRQGASVHLLPQERMPDNEQAVALLRY